MKRFVFMGGKQEEWEIEKYRISFFNPFDYEEKKTFYTAENLEVAYRLKKPSYMYLLESFLRDFKDVDILVCNWMNPFHPEWLIQHLPNTTKIYGLIDDPTTTYIRTIGQIWAFDGAYYVSPSYDEDFSMLDMLKLWGIHQYYWLPHSSWRKRDEYGRDHAFRVANSWSRRDRGVIHIGRSYAPKLESFRKMKSALGNDFHIFGRWQLKGYFGYIAYLKNILMKIRNQEWQNPSGAVYFYPHLVRPVSEAQKKELYLRYKIGFNIHYYERRDIGNSRMYEVALNGMMQLCDKGAQNLHESIFQPDVEAVYYESIEEAIDKAKFYLTHDPLREKIAKAGYVRAMREYHPGKCFLEFLRWAAQIPRRSLRTAEP